MKAKYYIFTDLKFNRLEDGRISLNPHTLIQGAFVCCTIGKTGQYHVINKFTSYVKNRYPLNQEIIDLTGITEKSLKNAPTLKEFKKSTKEWMEPYKDSYVIMSYGNDDYETVRFLFSTSLNRYTDVSKEVRKSFRLSKDVSLEKVHHTLFSTYHTVHDAYCDAVAIMKVMQEINRQDTRFIAARNKLSLCVKQMERRHLEESFSRNVELIKLTNELDRRLQKMYQKSDNNSVAHIRQAIARFITANDNKQSAKTVANYFNKTLNIVLNKQGEPNRKSVTLNDIENIKSSYLYLMDRQRTSSIKDLVLSVPKSKVVLWPTPINEPKYDLAYPIGHSS